MREVNPRTTAVEDREIHLSSLRPSEYAREGIPSTYTPRVILYQ